MRFLASDARWRSHGAGSLRPRRSRPPFANGVADSGVADRGEIEDQHLDETTDFVEELGRGLYRNNQPFPRIRVCSLGAVGRA
jgi:hypothetical protein